MAAYTTQAVSGETGADITFNTCNAGGDTIDYNALGRVIIDNADAASKTVTFTPFTTSVTTAAEGVLTRAPIVVTVPATTRRILKMPPGVFANATNQIAVTYSAVTSLRIGVVVLP
jgi:hypothetical protein